jgi:hypothetical protein
VKCGACGRACRKTSLALVAALTGGTITRRVCSTCLGHAVVIVPINYGSARCKCGEPSTSCFACARKGEARELAAVVKPVCKKLRALAKEYASYPDSEGLAEGLDRAANILEAGDY